MSMERIAISHQILMKTDFLGKKGTDTQPSSDKNLEVQELTLQQFIENRLQLMRRISNLRN
jgi:hypothetical protein